MSGKKGMAIAVSLVVLAGTVIAASAFAAVEGGYVYSVQASRDTYTYGLLSSTAFLGLFLIFLNLALRVRGISKYSLSPMGLAAGPVALLAVVAAMDAWALPATEGFLVTHPLVNTTVVYATSYGLPAAMLTGTLLASLLLRPAWVSSPGIPRGEGTFSPQSK